MSQTESVETENTLHQMPRTCQNRKKCRLIHSPGMKYPLHMILGLENVILSYQHTGTDAKTYGTNKTSFSAV